MPTSVRNTFSKQERLCSKIAIDQLIKSGMRINLFPFQVIWNKSERKTGASIQVAFSVSKRRFSKSVDRNRIKRLMRESYRLNKLMLIKAADDLSMKLDLLFIYTGKTIPEFKKTEEKIIVILQRLISVQTKNVQEDIDSAN